MPNLRSSLFACVVLPAAFSLASGLASATGIAVPAQSAKGAAVATAGMAAGIDDASTVFYNPAGMPMLARPSASVATGFVWSSPNPVAIDGRDVMGNSIAGSNDARRSHSTIPSVYGVFLEDPHFRMGLGISTPYGQRLNYDPSWKGRYEIIDASIQDSVLSLASSVMLGEALSVGGSVDYHKAEIKLRSAVDFGAVCLGGLGFGPCAGLGLLPQQADGASFLKLSGDGVGYTLGLIATASPWRSGIVYRSPVQLDLTGNLNFSVPASAGVLNAGGAFNQSAASAELKLPESIHWGLIWPLSQAAEMMAGVSWTRWSRFSSLHVEFSNPGQSSMNQELRWKNAFRYSLGGSLSLSAALTLQAGLAYQQSPVHEAYASPRFPIGSAREFNAGIIWKLRSGATLGLSYGYQKQRAMAFALSSPSAGQLQGSLRVKSESLGLQADLRF